MREIPHGNKQRPPQPDTEKSERLAEALRANLARRKTQKRARADRENHTPTEQD